MIKKAVAVVMVLALALPAIPAEGQTNIGNVQTTKMNGICNAANAAGANMGAKINSCVAALPATGGAIEIPAGQYTGIATGIVLNKPVRLIGAGTDNTVLTFTSNVTGITISPLVASRTLIQGMKLVGAGAATGTTGDGINAQATHYLRDVYVTAFRGTGVKVVASTPSANSNIWMHENVFSNGNGGDGFSWSGTDVNAGSSINCSANDNLGIGFNDLGGGSMNNAFINPNAANNTGGAWSIAGNSHYLLNPYTEQDSSTTSKMVLTAASYGNTVTLPRSAYPLTLTDSGANNTINYWRTVPSVDIFNVPNRTFIGIKPSVTVSPTVYQLSSGSFDNAALAFTDNTNSKNMLAYYPASGWKFLTPVNVEYLIPKIQLTDTTAGGHQYQISSGSFSSTQFAISDITNSTNYMSIFPASANPVQFLQSVLIAGGKNVQFNGATSGGNAIQAVATSGNGSIASLPALNSNDTLVLNNLAATFTNKTFDTAGTGNVFKIAGTTISANTGTGSNVLATSPALVTPSLDVATATSVTATGALSGSALNKNGVAQSFAVTADFTTAANTNLQTITGLSWTLPANIAQTVTYECHLAYAQGTAAVADNFGIQAATIAPTNIFGMANVQTAAGVYAGANLPTLNSTTATSIITFTPSAITTVWNADIFGTIENPSNASTNAISIQVKTSVAGDAITIKRGSFCKVY